MSESILSSTLLFIYKLLFLFVAIPLFFDLSTMSWVVVETATYNIALDSPSIPVPIGAFSLFFAIVLGYIISLVSPDKMKCNMPPVRLAVFYAFIVIPVLLYTLFVAGLAWARVAQILLPMLFISLLSFPKEVGDRIDVFRSLLIGASIFFILHFLSIMQSADLMDVQYHEHFSSFFGFWVYQSLVSYPGVLSLYLFLIFSTIYALKKRLLSWSALVKSVLLMVAIVILYLLAVSGRRAFIVEFVSAAVLLTISAFFYVLATGKLKKKAGLYVFAFLVLVMVFFLVYLYSPLSVRVVQSISNNTFDSGRVDILAKAYNFYSSNFIIFLFGGGPLDTPGFHNYVLDQIYRIGLFGFVVIYGVNGYLVVRFVRAMDYGTDARYARSIVMAIIFSCLFWQSMINASISQPYYFVNFLMVSLVAYFVLFSRQAKI